MEIKRKVEKLVKKHGTNNPFKIAKAMGIMIQYAYLGGILGFYSKHFRIKVIHINESAGEKQQLFTCAHELGHAILHPNANTPFLKKHTLFPTDFIEVEANEFAIELLFRVDDAHAVTFQEAIGEFGIPKEFIY